MLRFLHRTSLLNRFSTTRRSMSPPKVAVVGCGALGLNYGTRLLEAQLVYNQPIDVNLVLRRDYDLIATEGIVVEYGKVNEAKKVLSFTPENLHGKVFRGTDDLAACKSTMDWILVCCKSYSIDEHLHQSLIPLVGENSRLIVIMNGLGLEAKFVEWFGTEKVYGALSLIACNRGPNPPLAPGPLVVNVYADLKLEIAHITDNVDKTQLAIDLFKLTALRDTVTLSRNLLRARWDKLCWNLTYAGLSVAMGGLTCDVIAKDPALRQLATNVICDVIRVANADILRQHRARHGDAPLPSADVIEEKVILADVWPRTDGLGTYKSSTVLDLVAGRPLEMQYLFEVPLQRARELKAAEPSLLFSYLETVIMMVQAVSRMGEQKAKLGIAWQPTYFTDELTK